MKVAVIIGKDAHELERFAAEQLCDYLQDCLTYIHDRHRIYHP